MARYNRVSVLAKFLNVDKNEIIKHSKSVFEWKGITYEIVIKSKKTAPSSHYIKIMTEEIDYFMRELGEKSQIIKNMKGKV